MACSWCHAFLYCPCGAETPHMKEYKKMTDKKKTPTPFDDARWHLHRVECKLEGFWLGIWGRVRDARHHLEQVRLAVAAIEEQDGAAPVERLQK